MNAAQSRNDQAATYLMTMDILEHVLAHTDNPASLAEYLTRQIRELIGGKTVAMLECCHGAEGGQHRIVSVCPERQRGTLECSQMQTLAEQSHRFEKAVVLAPGQCDADIGAILRQMGWDTTLALPLVFGPNRYGALFVLNLQDTDKAGQMIQTIEKLSHVFALVLKTSLLFDRQEQVIRQRTAEIVAKERRFQALAEISPIGIMQIDAEGKCRYVNKRWSEITGTSVDTVLDESWSRIVHPDDLPGLYAAWQAQFPEKCSAESEFRCLRPDGKVTWILAHATVENDEAGNLIGYVCTFTDATERKAAEEHIAAEKDRLLVTLRSIGDGVITTDVYGKVVLINGVAESLTGWSQQQAQGQPISTVFNIINELTGKPCENPVERVLSTGEIIELANHTVLIAADGTRRVIADSGAPIRDRSGQTIGVVLVFRDMTEKQKLIEASQNNQKLESLGILAGGIAHDFNNLLGGIFGYIEIASEASSEPGVSGTLAKALATIDRARGLTQQLLTFAKGGAPVRAAGTLFPFIKETALFALSGSNVTAEFSVPKELWPAEFDANQIGQVIDNLVINAQQAMPLGGTIRVAAVNLPLGQRQHALLPLGRYVRISIRDSGIGIPREILPRIFDPFFTTKTKGHGLGLATCYSIVSRHGGCIEVESEPGEGSTFHLYLPACAEAVTAASQVMDAVGGSGRILVMDDEEVMREAIAEMLQSLGYSPVLLRDGAETLATFAADKQAGRAVAALILDLTIPGGLGGVEVVAEIRKLDATVPVLVSSGYAADPVMADPTRYGFSASLSKPFRKAELARVLQAHQGSARS